MSAQVMALPADNAMALVEYRGATGLTAGTFQVSARHLPYYREGKPVDRVLVLLRQR
jgi:hypothetical protein